MDVKYRVVVAGHLCLDVHPDMEQIPQGQFQALFQPGRLLQVGPATISTGGAVSNTGLALHRLGIPVTLIAKIGADPLGEMVRQVISAYDPTLLKGIRTDKAASTSYSLIINPPGVDRIFLHCPGVNDTFSAADVDLNLVSQADLFHFGYPQLMRLMHLNNGKELARLFKLVKETGVTTSLDMTFPDPSSESGQADWQTILKHTLPHVDLFLPSIEEILFMLRRATYERLMAFAPKGSLVSLVTPELLNNLCDELLDFGARIIVIKLGERGFYLRTASQTILQGLGRARPSDLAAWASCELWGPCFQVKVVGTTGAGDAAIAGFISALLHDLKPGEAVKTALAVGACCVEAADAVSGIRSWEETQARLAGAWPVYPLQIDSPDWTWDEQQSLWVGPGL